MTFQSARQIFKARWASESSADLRIVAYHSPIISGVIVEGSKSAKIGLIRFQPRHQSFRVANAFSAQVPGVRR